MRDTLNINNQKDQNLCTEIAVRDVAIANLKSKNHKMLEMIKRLVHSYEADVEFQRNVKEFLRQETDYLGDFFPSQKLSFEQLTAVRGGM